MNISHHLTEETLLDHAAGSLSMPMETLVACHLTVCEHCRSRALLAEAIGGSMLEEGESHHVLGTPEDLLARAAMNPEDNPSLAPTFRTTPGVPRPLGRLLPDGLEAVDWKRLVPGIKQLNLTDQPRRNGAFKLLYLEPGVVLSAHTHNERELTYLVRGSYQDEIGRFTAGDIADLDNDDVHQPVVDTHEPCIALIATHSPVRFTGVLGKIMQPFVGI